MANVRRQRFEDLPVWQEAIRLAVAVFELTDSGRIKTRGDLANQLERAALSISNNIAEGWERGTHEELLTFLYYARGSAGEVRSMLRLLDQLGLPEAHARLAAVLDLALSTSRQLGAWIESIKDSDSRGPRYRNSTTRKQEEQALRRADFQEQLRELMERARTPPEPPKGET